MVDAMTFKCIRRRLLRAESVLDSLDVLLRLVNPHLALGQRVFQRSQEPRSTIIP